MTNKSEKTIVVFRAPLRPLVCLRACDLPVPLEVGQVFDFDGVLYQQTHKSIACISRTGKGTANDANSLLKGIILRLYGEDEMTQTLARGTINYSAAPATNEKIAAGGIRIGVLKLLADDGEDLVFVSCRVVNIQYLREALSDTVRPASGAGQFSLTAPGIEAAKALSLTDHTATAATTSGAPKRRRRVQKPDK